MYAYCLNNPINFIDPTGNIALWIAALIIIGVAGIIAGSISVGVSISRGDSAGKVVLNLFTGFFAGVAIAGAILLLVGVIGVLATGIATVGSAFVTLAALGAAAMFLGSFVISVLNGEEPPESASFPEPGYVPVLPPPITG